MERDILELVVGEEAAKEFRVRLSPHRGWRQHLVLEQQLPYLVGQRPIHTALSVKGARVTDRSSAQKIFNQVEMTTKASIVERGGVPTISDVQLYLLLFC